MCNSTMTSVRVANNSSSNTSSNGLAFNTTTNTITMMKKTKNQQTKKSKKTTKNNVNVNVTVNNTKKRTRTISFSPQVAVKPITPVSQLVKGGDISKLWYTKSEAKEIKEECARLVEFFETYSMESLLELGQDHPLILKKLLNSLRGLEKHVNADEILQRRYNAWDAVFDEQDIQMGKVTDVQRIANAYKLHTIASQKEAYERALQDEQDVLYEQL